MGSVHVGGGAARRGKKVAAAEQRVKQPQRGLGVAQLEKIRLHNQMMAAYHSAGFTQQDVRMQAPFPASVGAPVASASSSFQPYLTDCLDKSDRRIGIQFYENLLPYQSNRPAMKQPCFIHDMKDSDQRMGQGRHHWMSSSSYEPSASRAEELDLELRL